VLIVEDEALVALELEELLLDEGFEVVGSAANAAQAIDLGRRHRPDLALLDLNLADGLTGPRIAKTLVRTACSSCFCDGAGELTTVRPIYHYLCACFSAL
jgi:DNA-binding NarL/FixJ family response regulator